MKALLETVTLANYFLLCIILYRSLAVSCSDRGGGRYDGACTIPCTTHCCMLPLVKEIQRRLVCFFSYNN